MIRHVTPMDISAVLQPPMSSKSKQHVQPHVIVGVDANTRLALTRIGAQYDYGIVGPNVMKSKPVAGPII